eukprot:6785997-Pyramimonas_sp.AAC.1
MRNRELFFTTADCPRRLPLTMDQSASGSAGIFSQWTNRLQEARVYSHNGPVGFRKRGYILTTDQSDSGSA